MSSEKQETSCLPCIDSESRDWYAWNDLMPPAPDYFHITGEVYVANPGVDPLLVVAEPQGINPRILLLDLYLCQKPGFWPQVFVWKSVRLDKKIDTGYSDVEVRCGQKTLAAIGVADVS